MKPAKRTTVVTFAIAAAVLAAGCGSSSESSGGDTGGASCTFTVQYKGLAYTAAGGNSDAKRGRKLGTAKVTPCADGDGPEQTVTLYEAVGLDPSVAVFAEPNVGLMRVDDPDTK